MCSYSTQEVRVHRVFRVGDARFRGRVERCEAECLHDGTHRVSADKDVVVFLQSHDDTTLSVVWVSRIDLVDRFLQCKGSLGWWCWRGVDTRSGDTQKLRLTSDADGRFALNE